MLNSLITYSFAFIVNKYLLVDTHQASVFPLRFVDVWESPLGKSLAGATSQTGVCVCLVEAGVCVCLARGGGLGSLSVLPQVEAWGMEELPDNTSLR